MAAPQAREIDREIIHKVNQYLLEYLVSKKNQNKAFFDPFSLFYLLCMMMMVYISTSYLLIMNSGREETVSASE